MHEHCVNMTATFARTFGVCLFAAGYAGAASAQRPVDASVSYPAKPIRMVVPSAPGGGTDIVARLIGQGLQEAWGQTVVVDNRGGAGGIPAVTMVAKNSIADGYTMCSAATVICPSLRPYTENFSLTRRRTSPRCRSLQVRPSSSLRPAVPANSMRELIALAKSRPGN